MTSAETKTATETSPAQPFGATLSRLYFTRFAFAVIWAALLFPSAKHTGAALTTLAIVYPLADAAAVLWQLRTKSRTARSTLAEWTNVAVSLTLAVALAWASTASLGATLAIWGAWAAASGLAQLAAAISRRTTGGQIPQIISGAISVLAGASFLAQAAKHPSSVSAIGGYAILGGVFFLISAIRLRSAS